MNIEDARDIVSKPDFLKRMVELNSSSKKYVSSLYESVPKELQRVFIEQNLNSYTFRCFVEKQYFNNDSQISSFLVVKNEYDSLLLVEDSLLKVVVCYVGGCVLAKFFTRAIQKKQVDLFKVVLGEQLFSYVMNYGRYAPYDSDLSIKNIDSSCLNSVDELSKFIMLYGLRALICITNNFSDSSLKDIFIARLIEIFGKENVKHQIVQDGENATNSKRIYSLVNKIIKHECA